MNTVHQEPDLFTDLPTPTQMVPIIQDPPGIKLSTTGEISAIAIEYAQAVENGYDHSFNEFRTTRRITGLPPWSGGIVSSICNERGLSIIGAQRAKAPASKGRLCAIWGRPQPK